jgi:hypothetical protein
MRRRSASRRKRGIRRSRSIKRRSRNKSINRVKTAAGLMTLAGLGYLGYKSYKYPKKQTYIEIMSDIEGCWNKIVDFMSMSDIFTYKGESISSINFLPKQTPEEYRGLKIKPGTKFVCLGDTIDNGPNNLAILRLMKYLKDNFGSQVILIIGNRDLNKIRLWFELFQDTGLNNNRPYISKLTSEKVPEFKTKLDKMKWLLKNTFGAGNAIKYIYEEITGKEYIDNDECNEIVFNKYKELLEVDKRGKGDAGLLFYYLTEGKVVYYDKSSKSIFSHGTINCSNFMNMIYLQKPSYTEKDQPLTIRQKDFDTWIKTLNDFVNESVELLYTGHQDEFIFEPIIRYQDEREYQFAKYSTILGRPWKTPPVSDQDALLGLGSSIVKEDCFDELYKHVRFLFNGHTPVGQIPVIYRLRKEDGKEIILVFCDTTFASRIGNTKIIKTKKGYHIQIKAKYSSPGEELKILCTDKKEIFKHLDYSTLDPLVGTIRDNKLIIAKDPSNDNYILGTWKLNNPSNPGFITPLYYEEKIN